MTAPELALTITSDTCDCGRPKAVMHECATVPTVRVWGPEGAPLIDFFAASGDVVIHQPDRMTEAALTFWREVQRIAEVIPAAPTGD